MSEILDFQIALVTVWDLGSTSLDECYSVWRNEDKKGMPLDHWYIRSGLSLVQSPVCVLSHV